MIQNLSLIPADLPLERISTCIGLISDTHVPHGMEIVSPNLIDAFHGVDLILHAGDVGDLVVLDALSQAAPVIAVAGNDDSVEAQQVLPYTQIVHLNGQRILLWHSHYLDLDEELAARADDRWQVKLDYLAKFGKNVGASIVIYGHSHIPMAHWHDGVLLINAGAAAMGTPVDRIKVRTAAILFLRDDGQPFVTHISATEPDYILEPHIDFDAGFKAALRRYSESLLHPDLQVMMPILRPIFMRDLVEVRLAFLRLAQERWSHAGARITIEDVITHVCDNPRIPAEARDKARKLLLGRPQGNLR